MILFLFKMAAMSVDMVEAWGVLQKEGYLRSGILVYSRTTYGNVSKSIGGTYGKTETKPSAERAGRK